MTSLSPALPARLTVAGLDFEVQLSGVRRSIGITVDRDGSLIVNAPRDCHEAELAAFAHEKRMWVYKKLAGQGPPAVASPDEGVRQRRGLLVSRPIASPAADRSARR